MEREREQGSDRLDTEERKELNDSDFGLPEERKYPMPDACVASGIGYFRSSGNPKSEFNSLRSSVSSRSEPCSRSLSIVIIF